MRRHHANAALHSAVRCRTLNGVDVDDNDVDMEDQSVNAVGSLIKRVQKSCLKHLDNEDRWREFISVNCLRNHAMFGDVPVMNQSESCLNVITHT